MKNIDPKTLKQAQRVMLDSLISFDKICEKHHLKYWLDSGTLLGAVRHDGFIPWDDDIDISMPIEDYQKFMTVAQDELDAGPFLQSKQTDPCFPFDYMKIRSDRATIIEFHEDGKKIDYHQGVFVDIFPMLAIKNTPLNRLFYRYAFAAIRLFSAKHFQVNWLRGLLVKALHRLHLGWGHTDSIVIYGGEMPDVAAYFDYNSLYPLKKKSFEHLEFNAPNDSKTYLKQIYSFNFMELPPEDKRTIHAAAIKLHTKRDYLE